VASSSGEIVFLAIAGVNATSANNSSAAAQSSLLGIRANACDHSTACACTELAMVRWKKQTWPIVRPDLTLPTALRD
jgi:hypothetical protein